MLQLEQRFYSRKEIAEVLGVNINDSNHFAEKAKNRLKKWGYGFVYTQAGVTIQTIPATAEERLAELMIREYNLDVQIAPYDFACFVIAFYDVDGFSSMPWEKRALELRKNYGVSITDRTLRNWCSKLLSLGIISKHTDGSCWKTEYINGVKHRTQVQKDEAQAYFNRRSEIIEKETEKYRRANFDYKTARSMAWKYATQVLWDEYSCCYYKCKNFLFTAFAEENNESLLEMYELAREIKDEIPKRFS